MKEGSLKVTKRKVTMRDFRADTLLGGKQVLGSVITSPMEVHKLIIRGLPREALRSLSTYSRLLENKEYLKKAVGISVRTTQRHKNTPEKRLNPEQSGRTWRYAEILAKTAELFGTVEAAETWLATPAMGLDQHRPIDLLATPAGAGMVDQLLTRLEYGVYT